MSFLQGVRCTPQCRGIFTVKVVIPRLTLRNAVRATFKLIGWPIKALVQVVREEWDKADDPT